VRLRIAFGSAHDLGVRGSHGSPRVVQAGDRLPGAERRQRRVGGHTPAPLPAHPVGHRDQRRGGEPVDRIRVLVLGAWPLLAHCGNVEAQAVHLGRAALGEEAHLIRIPRS
jgi:hypothetical protein